MVDFIVTIYGNGGCRTFVTCLTLTFLNRSGNPATGSWQHLEKIQCMFSSEFFFIYGILYSSSERRGGIASCTTMTVTLKPTLNLNLPLYMKAG